MRGKLGEGELRLNQWHHAYLGLIILVLGALTHHEWIRMVGWVVTWDDLLQHLIQWLYDNEYHSPLHVLYSKWIWGPLHK